MKNSAPEKTTSRILSSILPAVILALPLIFMAGCSDSERRLANDSGMTTVLINLGGASASKSGRLAASAPSNITSVNVTVTGPGMTPISQTLTSAPGTIDLSVPSGPSRLFAVVVTTTDGIYSGTAIASLPEGATVSVPIVMEYGGLFGFSNEGTIDNPVVLTLVGPGVYSADHVGTVGRGKSYYRIDDPITHSFLDVSMAALTDDADLLNYGGDSTYDGTGSIQFKQNYNGRTMDESFSVSSPPSSSYFIVDGSHTKNGARFMIKSQAHDGMVTGGPPIGSIVAPNIIPVGMLYESMVTPTDPYNYYVALINNGTQYWVNGYDFDYSPVLTVYTNPLFSTPTTNPFTGTGSIAAFNVYEMVTGNDIFNIEVVTHEGTMSNPVELSASDIFGMGRANFCMVGGGYGASYYRVPISIFDFYVIEISDIKDDINLTVYSGPSFSSPELKGSSNNSGTVSDAVAFQINDGDLPDGNLYIKVSDNNGTGSTFVLSVMRTIY